MIEEGNKRHKKLDGISHGKTVRRTTPLKASQPSNGTNIRKDIEPTKENLRNLAERWKGVNQVHGFLSELWNALGIASSNGKQQKGGNPSRYAAFQLQDGTVLTVTIRASAHNANADTYLKDGNINGDTNLSIVLQKRSKKNTFVPHDDVQLSEYVYVENRLSSVESPLSQIAMSLIGYLTNGEYVDTTGVAIAHISPQTTKNNETNENKQHKTRYNMKKTIRLSESDLHRVIKESVKRIIKEAGHLYWTDDEGTPHTNSKETWHGVPGAIFVSHGEWSDPEIIYKGKSINYYDAEDGLYYYYETDVEDRNFKGSFDEWVSAQDPRYLASFLDDYIMD